MINIERTNWHLQTERRLKSFIVYIIRYNFATILYISEYWGGYSGIASRAQKTKIKLSSSFPLLHPFLSDPLSGTWFLSTMPDVIFPISSLIVSKSPPEDLIFSTLPVVLFPITTPILFRSPIGDLLFSTFYDTCHQKTDASPAPTSEKRQLKKKRAVQKDDDDDSEVSSPTISRSESVRMQGRERSTTCDA